MCCKLDKAASFSESAKNDISKIQLQVESMNLQLKDNLESLTSGCGTIDEIGFFVVPEITAVTKIIQSVRWPNSYLQITTSLIDIDGDLFV